MTGTVTFSIEIELGWGLVHYGKLEALSPKREDETRYLERLLDLCDELGIPVTFNVVGHLLLDEPLSSYAGGHERDWYDDIPKTGPQEDPEFYAPDLVERIKSTSIDHEICTHTYTHVECANVSTETLQWEFDRVFETHDEFGLERPVSLVPPRHSPPPRDVLREYGIDIVRAPRARAPNASEASNRLQLAIDTLSGKQPNCPPRLVDGVVETYCTRYPSLSAPFLTYGRLDPHPFFKVIPSSLRKRRHRKNLERQLSRTIELGSYAHLWTHLWEIANSVQWPIIDHFLRAVSNAHGKGEIRIKTMEDLSKEEWA